ncbi:hypothetical protein P7C70_g5881, partial [Phenoliferia sp. Uapishka_3]
MTAKSSGKRFSLAKSFRDLVNTFLDTTTSPTPFDRELARGGFAPGKFVQRTHDRDASYSGSDSSNNSRNSGMSFESMSSAASSWASTSISSQPGKLDQSPPPPRSNSGEGHWEGHGAERRWVSPFASPFPVLPSNFRRHSRSTSYVDTSVFASNNFRFAATSVPDEIYEEEEPNSDDDTADDEAVQALQESFARSQASNRRRGAISSASMSIPAMKPWESNPIDQEIQIDTTAGGSAYDEACVEKFMGLHLSNKPNKPSIPPTLGPMHRRATMTPQDSASVSRRYGAQSQGSVGGSVEWWGSVA